MSTSAGTRPNRQILYAHRPDGRLTREAFTAVEASVGEPGPGEVLCRTVLLSVDPANRAWMQGRTYRDQLQEGEVMAGFTLCEVIAEEGTGLPVGSVVACEAGWQEYAVLPVGRVQVIPVVGPLTHHMSVLGVTGLTAYFGLLRVGRPEPGEVVLVSAAAGATGNVVGQIAKGRGCRVVGITGSEEKNRMLVSELGFDEAVNYRSPAFGDDLRRACPAGIDVYFDNVGGSTLELALRLLRGNGRVVCCGAVSQYDTANPAADDGVRGVPGLLITKRLRMEGFIVMDFAAEWAAATQELAAWIASGRLKVLEEVLEGLDAAPGALVGLLSGDNVGKRMVRVGPDPAGAGSDPEH
jgi:NADPH-dependent curcumin reductase CurA